jgi:hypothetical protein
MPFEAIDFVGAPPSPAKAAVPIDGVRVTARRMGLKARGGETEPRVINYIRIDIGRKLAKDMALHGEQLPMAVAFGNGADAGKIRIAVDAAHGRFVAKVAKTGQWYLTINAATAEGLFSLDFPPFSVLDIRPVFVERQPPAITFAASAEMLAID